MKFGFKKKYLEPLFLIIISLIPLLPLLRPGLPITHDGQDHVARIANFYLSLTEGNLVPRWAENLNWGYGHPILMFLYPLPSYFASLFHLIGFSFVDSTKLVFAAAFVLSGVFMYMWIKKLLRSTPAIVAALAYMFAPYRFVDFYVRGAIGEHMAFVFLPLILYFLLKLSIKFKSIYVLGGMLSLAGLILSHNAISIMFLPFIIFYALFLILQSNNKLHLIYQYASILIFGFCLSAFFLIPAFFEGKYTLRDIVTSGEALKRFVDFNNLIYSPWNFGGSGQFSVQIGIVQWIAFLFSPVVIYFLFKKDKKNLILYLGVLIYFVLSLFIMLPFSEPIWKTFTTLQKFQFPWRFLSISVFSTAVLAGYAISIFKKRSRNILLILAVISILILNRNYWSVKGYLNKPESFFTGIYAGTTDTGESSPIWSIRFMEKSPANRIEVIEGKANIKELKRTSTHHSYEINSNYSSIIKENTLYFPGWKVFIDGREYKGVQFQIPQYRGLMTFRVLNGKHRVDIKFEDTKLRMISNFISLFALLGIVVFLIADKLFLKYEKNN